MKIFPINCGYCKKVIYRSRERINEAKKFGWKAYCSLVCQSKVRNKQQALQCSNPKCGNIFKRMLKDIRSSNLYCSRSCAASINNSKFPKRKKPLSKCNYCGKEFFGNGKHCSTKCQYKSQTITKKEICRLIKEFYIKNKRIPP